jgi:hypothetical protein
MDNLYLFSAGSANDHIHHHLWLKGASLFIPQINELVEYTDYSFEIININTFQNIHTFEKMQKLGDILKNNLSDKSTTHNYHILYSHIFNELDETINILEIGLGTNNPELVSTMGHNGRPGASLYGFREYLPKANIYGCDIDKNILFDSDRIKTCYVDQLDKPSFNNITTSFGNLKYDLIIDDGLHSIGANLNTLLFALEHVNQNGWIVIEDIHIINNWKSIDFILKSTKKYVTYMLSTNNDSSFLYVIKKL